MRVRVGVGRPDSTDPEIVSAHVLGRFRESDEQVAALIERRVRAGRARRARRRRRAGRGGRARWRRAPARCARCWASSQDDEPTLRLAREGGHAFVSSSLRPYLIAALAEIDEHARSRPTLVVVGDDRAARDLAADLRAWLAPRRVRYYPSRGVAYESHLAPPAHLVGLRVAALDALLGEGDRGRSSDSGGGGVDDGQPVVVVSAVALSEKVPDPQLRPHSFTLRVGELLDLEECAAELVGAGYERVDQVEERGQFALRGGLLDVFPATEERAVRVDMFDVEIESLRWFSTFTQRSLGEVEEVEIAPAAELAVEHRELAEIAAATGAFASDRRRGRRAPGHRRAAAGRALRRAARSRRRGRAS